MKINDAIILGADHHNTYGVIRALNAIGIKPIVLVQSLGTTSCFSKSKLVDKIVMISEEETVGWLLNYAKSAKNKAVIYISSDQFSSLVDANRDKLIPYFYLPGSTESGVICKYMDKELMGNLAKECGLSLPGNSNVINKSDLTDKISNYPCIIKPLKSIEGHKSDIFVCYTKNELKNIESKIECSHLIVQDFIQKKFEYQLIGLSLNSGKNIIIPGVTKLLWAQSNRTNTGIVRIDPLESYNNIPIAETKKFIESIGYSGSFSVEFIRDEHDRDYFMEINFRNDGNSIVVTGAGVNLHKYWYEYNVYNTIPSSEKIKSIIAIPFWGMLTVARREHKLKDLLGYLLNKHILMDISIRDISAIIPMLSSIARKLLK